MASWERCAALLILCAGLPLCGCRKQPPPAALPLKVGLYAAPLGLDPHFHNEFLTFSVLSNAFEALTSLDAYLRVQPALAESWSSPDEATWRFRLRQGVVFHDGRPLRAADVVFSLQRARRHPRSEFASYLVAMQAVRATDERTVEIVTDRPNAMLPSRLAFVLVVPRGSPDEIVAPLGSGPYRIASIAGDGSVVLKAFERHWLPPAAEPEVQFQVLTGGGRGRRLLAGEVDVLVELAPEELSLVRSDRGFRVLSQAAPSVAVLQMRVDVPPFSDARVRRAVHLALDRQALVEALLGGQGQPASQLVNRSAFGFDPDLTPAVRDLSAARRLLGEAGYPDGLDVALEYREGRRAEPIARQLGEAGFRIRLEPRPLRKLMERLANGRTRLSYGSLVSDSGDASDVYDSTLHTRDPARGFGDSNYSGYANPRLDALIESAGGAAQLTARRKILQDCMRLAIQDLPIVPLFVHNQLYAFRTDVTWEPRADARVLAQDLRRTVSER